MNKNVYEFFLTEINLEEIKIKKYKVYIIVLTIIFSVFTFTKFYKNGMYFMLLFFAVVIFCIHYTCKKTQKRLLELKYSKNILVNNPLIKEEILSGELNSIRGYLLTENFYLDFNSKNIIDFRDVKKISLRFSLSFIPFSCDYGLSQYIYIITENNKKIGILNWSFSHHYPEDGEIYDIFVKKVNEKKEV